ncbi:MAG: hypothetical protein ACYTG7_19145 [Planctomycetota bacterium]|jgi:hypothetical protein
MKRFSTLGVIVLWILISIAASAVAKDIVVNDGFSTMSWIYWTPSGNPHWQWIDYFDVSGSDLGFCLAQRVGIDYSGGLTQDVFVIEGVTYTVSADFAYRCC